MVATGVSGRLPLGACPQVPSDYLRLWEIQTLGST